MNNAQLNELKQRYVAKGAASPSPQFVERAENAELWDVEGKRYIDFAGGIAVLNTGHLNPTVKSAVAAQLEKLGNQTNAALDALIRQERIDALIELNGHTAENRLPALARKPAPVRVTYLGYPDSTGHWRGRSPARMADPSSRQP